MCNLKKGYENGFLKFVINRISCKHTQLLHSTLLISRFIFYINSIGGGKPSCQREFTKITSCWDKTCAGEKATAPCPMLFFRTDGKPYHEYSHVTYMNLAAVQLNVFHALNASHRKANTMKT